METSAFLSSFKHPPPPLIYNPTSNQDIFSRDKRLGSKGRSGLVSHSLEGFKTGRAGQSGMSLTH